MYLNYEAKLLSSRQLKSSETIYGTQQSWLLESWGTWLGMLAEWAWFVTLTPREPSEELRRTGFNLPGLVTARKMWLKWCKEYAKYSGVFDDQLRWVRVIEFQKWRGAAHVHGLVAAPGGDARELRRWSWERFGWNKIYEYVPDKGAEYYICKYIVKDLQDIRFSEALVDEGRQKRSNFECRIE